MTIQLMRSQPTLWAPALTVAQALSAVFVIKTENNITKRIPVQPGATKDSPVEIFWQRAGR
ncbi:MAG: hypothetical protein ACXWWD_05440 [Chitinophagaceae bacterium]